MPWRASIEAMLTIDPPPWVSIWGMTAAIPANAGGVHVEDPPELVEAGAPTSQGEGWRHCSPDSSRPCRVSGPRRARPTRRVVRPEVDRRCRPGVAAVAVPSSTRTSANTTAAPSATKRRAMAAPVHTRRTRDDGDLPLQQHDPPPASPSRALCRSARQGVCPRHRRSRGTAGRPTGKPGAAGRRGPWPEGSTRPWSSSGVGRSAVPHPHPRQGRQRLLVLLHHAVKLDQIGRHAGEGSAVDARKGRPSRCSPRSLTATMFCLISGQAGSCGISASMAQAKAGPAASMSARIRTVGASRSARPEPDLAAAAARTRLPHVSAHLR